MFWIFKIFPDWLFYFILLAGIFGFFASYWKPLKTYDEVLKSIGLLTIVGGIFLLGMLYADNAWKSAAKELQAKADTIAIESKNVTANIDKDLVAKKQLGQQKTLTITQYIDREVKSNCELPQEVLTAHNKAIK